MGLGRCSTSVERLIELVEIPGGVEMLLVTRHRHVGLYMHMLISAMGQSLIPLSPVGDMTSAGVARL